MEFIIPWNITVPKGTNLLSAYDTNKNNTGYMGYKQLHKTRQYIDLIHVLYIFTIDRNQVFTPAFLVLKAKQHYKSTKNRR